MKKVVAQQISLLENIVTSGKLNTCDYPFWNDLMRELS
jgi:hypothetical protein